MQAAQPPPPQGWGERQTGEDAKNGGGRGDPGHWPSKLNESGYFHSTFMTS
jgi:hypothetical protein